MTIIHVDTASAAGSGSNPANDLNLPSPGFEAIGSSSPWNAYGVVLLYGDTNDSNEGTWEEDESGGGSTFGTWINDTSEIDEWLIRMVGTNEYGTPSNDLALYYNAAAGLNGWLAGQSNWEAFGNGLGWNFLTVDTQFTFAGGWSYGGSGETIVGTLEFAKGATGLLETFTDSDVNVGANTITIAGHGFKQGDAVLYTQNSGATPSNWSDNTLLYIRYIDANTVGFGSNMSAVDATEIPYGIIGTGTGTSSLRRIEADGTCSIEVDADD